MAMICRKDTEFFKALRLLLSSYHIHLHEDDHVHGVKIVADVAVDGVLALFDDGKKVDVPSDRRKEYLFDIDGFVKKWGHLQDSVEIVDVVIDVPVDDRVVMHISVLAQEETE